MTTPNVRFACCYKRIDITNMPSSRSLQPNNKLATTKHNSLIIVIRRKHHSWCSNWHQHLKWRKKNRNNLLGGFLFEYKAVTGFVVPHFYPQTSATREESQRQSKTVGSLWKRRKKTIETHKSRWTDDTTCSFLHQKQNSCLYVPLNQCFSANFFILPKRFYVLELKKKKWEKITILDNFRRDTVNDLIKSL